VKITDVTLTLFSWESIPPTIYGHHTARPTGKSDLGLLRIVTDEGIEGHAFLGTSSNPASLDGPMLIRFLKPVVMGQDPLDRERLNKLLWARARVATVRSIGVMHGYGIARHIQTVSEDVLTVEEGSLYPALQRLQIQGFVASEWGHSANNRRARYYRLTRAGRRALGDAESSFDRLIAAIARVMRPA